MAAPPRLPAKDRSITQERLVDALRESVVISPPSASYQPAHNYSRSTGGMVNVASPQLNHVQRTLNPFEEDEIEPEGDGRIRPPSLAAPVMSGEAAGVIPPSRAKFSRASSGNPPVAPAAPSYQKIRRSMSTDSYGTSSSTTLAATQLQAARDKKGSKHADVIDTWDPTGLGNAMWHHSGPYDAAAPSRNVNLPKQKAPMQAFLPPNEQSEPSGSNQVQAQAQPPAPPSKSPPLSQRAQSALRHGAPPYNRARSSGGGALSGQYSTSMPSSGGYFPQQVEDGDEHERARKERERERESKRRALKAAWGIDEPEPFEDFGASPGHEDVDLDDDYFDQSPAPQASARPARSPGLRLSNGPRTPPITVTGSYATDGVSPIDENAPVGSGQTGGVKRTKSLMQKIKSMRENPNVPLGNGSARPRSNSPFSARQRGSNGSNTPTHLSPSYDAKQDIFADEDDAVSPIEPSANQANGFVLSDSPSSKDRARQALLRERQHSASREKTLPVPPVGPVLPDFMTDEMNVQAQLPRVAQVQQDASVGVRRKPSFASKLKGKIAGRS